MFESLHQELDGVPVLTDKNRIFHDLASLLSRAVAVSGTVGLAFSGGVDSSILAELALRQHMDVTLYSVGLEGSSDLAEAQRLAAAKKWKLKTRVYTLDEAEALLKKVYTLIPHRDIVNLGVGCVVYAVLELAKQDQITTIIGGLGSEELFAGYERHSLYKTDFTPSHIHERLWEGLRHLEERDLARDLSLARYFSMRLQTPFLDPAVVRYAMQIAPELKMNSTTKKIILREFAETLGIPPSIAWRKKIAAQYGSKFDKAIRTLALRHGFPSRKEYLASLATSVSRR